MKIMIQKIKNSLNNNGGILFSFSLIGILVFGAGMLSRENKTAQITKATVMITRLTNGGGTGVIYKSSKNESIILTNVHVCEAVKDGGVVNTSWGAKHLVTKYTESKLHDVCMVYVQADLGVNTKIASKNPEDNSPATTSGHPNLLPVTITKGFWADKRIIQVFMGVKPCTVEQTHDPELGQLCLFFGGVPVLKTFDSRFVTTTIMAGSSGSAIYNESGEIGGLVFAGSGDLSYAFTVPYEFVSNFVDNESKTQVIVDYTRSLDDLMKEDSSRKKYNSYITEKCLTSSNDAVEPYCKTIVKDLEFRKELL